MIRHQPKTVGQSNECLLRQSLLYQSAAAEAVPYKGGSSLDPVQRFQPVTVVEPVHLEELPR